MGTYTTRDATIPGNKPALDGEDFSEITANSFISWRSAHISNLWKMYHRAVYFLTNELLTVKKCIELKDNFKI